MRKENIEMKNENNKKPQKVVFEFARFVLTGAVTTLIDIIVMGVVLYLFNPKLYPHFFNVWFGGGNPSTIATVVGTSVGFGVGIVCSYLLSICFVFNNKGNSKTAKGTILFFVFSIVGFLLNMAGMWLGYDIIGINEWIVKIIMTLVVLVYNFITRKLFIFKKTEENKNTSV